MVSCQAITKETGQFGLLCGQRRASSRDLWLLFFCQRLQHRCGGYFLAGLQVLHDERQFLPQSAPFRRPGQRLPVGGQRPGQVPFPL